jgi:hypothetical protein
LLKNSDVILYLGPSAHLLHGISVLLVHYTIFVDGLYSSFFSVFKLRELLELD